ncbi:unnamed protein product [Arabis nemorensis]|uniref:Phytocyanin domain-containing protein n=1 Tax=Arabis nemorensis TaxID=586526 RepID=A0A565AYF0_9BRAS|nr:unnamed protein product [Arabis nemorensis]
MARSSGHVSYLAAAIPMAILLTIICLFLATNVTHASRRPTTYIVGDEYGWDLIFSLEDWPRGKTFYAGDILVFKYNYEENGVWVVNRTGYETCTANDGAKEYNSGNDRIQLPYGYSYYIGIFNPLDCSAGLKMAVKALAPK